MRRHVRAGWVLALAVALTLTGLAGPAQAEPTGAGWLPSRMSAEPASFWQADRVVWAMEQHGGVVYAGGTFNNVRPPGANRGGAQEVAQGRLAAFNASTGALISSWRPTVAGGSVYALSVSPNGSRLYVGGTFTSINGQTRRRLAVFDISNPANPSLLPTSAFNARSNRKVFDIYSTNTTVYVGGAITRANNTPRTYIAAFTANGGDLLPFAPQIGDVPSDVNAPWVSSISGGNGRIYIGGQFLTVNGVAQTALGVVDAVTGASVPFNIPVRAPNGGWVTDLTYDAPSNTVFLVGRVPPSRAGTRLEGIEALDGTTGEVKWGGDNHRCLGDAFGVMVFQGVVWMATHAHDCSQIGGFPESTPRFSWHAALLGQDIETGEQVAFYPQVSGRPSVAGSLNNTRALTNDGTNIFVGGGFLSVDGFGNQQNLIKFVPKGSGGGVEPARPARPTLSSSGGSVTIEWNGVFDRDDRTLTFQVLRGNNNQLIYETTVDSPWWAVPTMSFTDTGRNVGSTQRYRIRVRDASNVRTGWRRAIVVQ